MAPPFSNCWSRPHSRTAQAGRSQSAALMPVDLGSAASTPMAPGSPPTSSKHWGQWRGVVLSPHLIWGDVARAASVGARPSAVVESSSRSRWSQWTIYIGHDWKEKRSSLMNRRLECNETWGQFLNLFNGLEFGIGTGKASRLMLLCCRSVSFWIINSFGLGGKADVLVDAVINHCGFLLQSPNPKLKMMTSLC
jgi:hypothetical protein